MKVGVITFQNANNYGAILQAYALQTSIQKLGCEVQVIDYRNPYVASIASKPNIRDYHNPLKYINDRDIFLINEIKRRKILNFIENNITITRSVSREELRDFADKFDVVFSGSDQVWNDKITRNDDTYYLDFLSPEKRCSYGASIGSSEIQEENIPRVNRLLSQFRAISVREKTAVDALNNQLGIQSVQVLDPTLLLSKKEYCSHSKCDKSERYVLLYMLIYSETLITSAKKIAKKLELPLYCINSSGKKVSGCIDKSNSGVEEWLTLFENAEFILTNSFHGTAFSINYNKKFNVELPPSRIKASSRITDLLDVFHLEQCLVNNGDISDAEIEYGRVNEILNHERQKSISFIRKALDGEYIPKKQTTPKSILVYEWDHCCGCGLCEKVCPTHAITMRADINGFAHPHIETIKCNQCGTCMRNCPFAIAEKRKKDKVPLELYAAYSDDSDAVMYSSSGGVFYEIAKNTLDNQGVVYGAAFTKDFSLEHRRVTSLNELKPLMGSKYVQSNSYKVFDDVLQDLELGRKVLFVGTPCQIAAIKSLSKQRDENLLTVDFVCHGVPSPILLKNHIQYVGEYFRSKVIEYRPRSKVMGWGHNELFIFENGKKEYRHPLSQAYRNIFYKDCCFRGSCYNCPFTCFDRPGDITISDYWGIEQNYPELYRKEGISMIMENSEKGKSVISQINSLIKYKTGLNSITEIKQPHLFRPLKHPTEREAFWNDYHLKGWKYVAEKYVNCDIKSLAKWRVKSVLRSIKKNWKG